MGRWVRLSIVGGAVVALVAAGILVTRSTSQAATCDYWIGGSGNFNAPVNWSTGVVPNSADDACITQTTSSTPPAAADTYTVLFDGISTVNSLQLGAPSGKQTLQLAGNNTQFFLNTGTINSNGILLVGDGNVSNGYTWLGAASNTSVLTNNGSLETVQGGGGIRYLRVSITNAAGGTVDVAASDTRVDGFGSSLYTATNNGTFVVETGAAFAFSNGGSFINQGGSVTNSGAFSQSGGHFIQRGGSELGNPVVLHAGGLDDDLSAGPAKFTISCPGCPPYPLTGTGLQPGVAADQLITIAGDNSWVDLGVSFTNAGTIVLGDAGSGYSVLRGGTNSVVLTNTGYLNTVQGGGGIRYLRVNVTNAAGGIVDLAAADSRQDGSGATTVNNGAFVIHAGSTMSFSGGSTFTQGSGGTFETTINANTPSFGQLNGGGEAVNLDGTLKVNTVGHPAVSSSWPIITNANRSGTFASQDFAGWNYAVQYPAGGVILVAQASCDTWIGGVDNNFNTAGNWSLGFVPGSADDACITATTSTNPPANADTYTVIANSNPTVHSLTLGGPSGTQTLLIPSSFTFDIGADSSIGAHGVLTLGDSAAGANAFGCSGAGCTPNSPTLTNTGVLKTVQGDGSARHIQLVLVVNATGGTTDVGGNTLLQGGCQPGGGANNNKGFLNSGTVAVRAGGNLTAECGFVNNSGATVSNLGAFSVGGSVFKQRGSETGAAVVITNGSSLDDDTSAGTGSFTFTSTSGGLTGTGSSPGIAAGQVVTVASGTTVGVFPNATNNGTLIMGDSGNGDSALCCTYFTAGPTITNTGIVRTAQGGGGIRHLQVNIENAAGGLIDLAANDTRQDAPCGDNATWITNGGTFTLEVNSHFTVSTCPGSASHPDTFSAQSGGTFQTTINANTISFGRLTGGFVNLDGKLRVTTVGWPSTGSDWPIISGATRTGTFASFDICGPNYDVEYAPTSVTLVVSATQYDEQSTSQETLANSDGHTWQPMDPAQLAVTFTPSADSYAVVNVNADLWTSVAGYNQDLGISVSGGGSSPGPGVYPTVAGQPEAWKESGGFAGTFSPNAAFVQTVVLLEQGQAYTVKPVWKANRNAPGVTIWAGAGPIGGKYSPTRLTVQLLPASTSNLRSAAVTNQPSQSGSNGVLWKTLDGGLSFQYTPCVNGLALLTGNVDLWTSSAGYNQDVGISVSGGAYPTHAGQPEAWKESGGFAGTFSPNAAFVQGMVPLTANTTYTITMTWKANKASPASATIWAGAGPINGRFSPTRLSLQFIPSTGGPPSLLDAASTRQYTLTHSDGVHWQDIDITSATPLRLQFQSTTSCTAVLTANADLWTDTAGYNQDVGVAILGGGYPTVAGQPEAWKESGGFAGTYSPNAAFLQMVLPVAANTPYTVTLQWKANKAMPASASIWTGAGPIGPEYSPTRLTAQLLGCS